MLTEYIIQYNQQIPDNEYQQGDFVHGLFYQCHAETVAHAIEQFHNDSANNNSKIVKIYSEVA